jgi:hypothetical protein
MRACVTILVIASLELGAACASADTIHLKNGRTILADSVRENGDHCEYNIGDNAYAIPKSSVERVEAGGAPVSAASGAAKVAGELPSFAPSDSLANEGDLAGKIVHDGKVDSDVLSNLESKGNLELSATANFIAGKFEFEHGNINQARRYFDSALRFQPENSTILVYYAALLVRTGNPSQAVTYAHRAVRHSGRIRLRPTSGSVKVVILSFTMKANKAPRCSADKFSPLSNQTTTIWSATWARHLATISWSRSTPSKPSLTSPALLPGPEPSMTENSASPSAALQR